MLDPAPTGEVLLIWGGSSSVGSNAIQFARGAGYEVVTTCSQRNFDHVRRLGAAQVFDYRDAAAAKRGIVSALRGRRCAGAVAIGKGSAVACMDILSRCDGRRFAAQVTPPTSFDAVPAGRGRLCRLVPAMAGMVLGNVALILRARLRGVRTRMIWGGSLVNNEVGPLIYERSLPRALAAGVYKAMPEPIVVGDGLDRIPEALERQRAGISAGKVVVRLG